MYLQSIALRAIQANSYYARQKIEFPIKTLTIDKNLKDLDHEQTTVDLLDASERSCETERVLSARHQNKQLYLDQH